MEKFPEVKDFDKISQYQSIKSIAWIAKPIKKTMLSSCAGLKPQSDNKKKKSATINYYMFVLKMQIFENPKPTKSLRL